MDYDRDIEMGTRHLADALANSQSSDEDPGYALVMSAWDTFLKALEFAENHSKCPEPTKEDPDL